jgi:hypothetical protein
LKFIDFDNNSSLLKFKFTDEETGNQENFDFSLKYWISQINYKYNDEDFEPENSGLYLFSPI